ncbi:MAG: DNA repair protein RecO [Candidatus Marinimicrobia bacterium]|nr:DNA repair protein RecO [Candidatus Neomarinimicrobiota bacterium]MBL7023127.1 DNA repair protein RecO [Candidatus Neomarinimicrobiota bacterium]MBL7109065.1 DNA repair protein RecO [Candidatus Neomarinimicrobiota bacterium]
MIVSTDGVVLKSFPYGDTSLITRFYTKDFGKVTLIAKGVRKAKNPTGAILEPMNVLNLNYYAKENRDMHILKEASLHRNFTNIRNDIISLTTGLAMVEMLEKTSDNNDPSPILFRLINRTLHYLDEGEVSSSILLLFFQYQLSLRLGYKPHLNTCSACKHPLQKPMLNSQTGELNCSKCTISHGISISEKAIIFMKQIASTHIENLLEISDDKAEQNQAVHFMSEFMRIHIEGMQKIKSLTILNQLEN